MTFKLSILLSVFFALFFLATCKNESAIMSDAGGDQKIKTKIAPPNGQTLPDDINKFRINYTNSEFQITLNSEFDLINKSATLNVSSIEGTNCSLTYSYSDEVLDELKNKISELRYRYTNLGNDNLKAPSGGCGSVTPQYENDPRPDFLDNCILFAFDINNSQTINISENIDCQSSRKIFEYGVEGFINTIYTTLSEDEEIGTCPENWDIAFETQE